MNLNKELLIAAQKEVDYKLSNYNGMKVSELKSELSLSCNNKASFVQLARKMMGITNNQFSLCNNKVNVILKTVRLTGNGNPAEAMSFMPVDFNEWTGSQSWENSDLYEYFYKNTLLLFVFRQYPTGQRVKDDEMTFLGARLWKMPEYDLHHGLKEVWENVRFLINEDNLILTSVTQKSGRIIIKNNLPSSKFNYLGHLRPGGINGDDRVLLPTGQFIVKQRFWFNSDYVKDIINLQELLNNG